MMLSFLIAMVSSGVLWVTGWVTIPMALKVNAGVELTAKQVLRVNTAYFTTRILILWPVFYFVLPLFLESK